MGCYVTWTAGQGLTLHQPGEPPIRIVADPIQLVRKELQGVTARARYLALATLRPWLEGACYADSAITKLLLKTLPDTHAPLLHLIQSTQFFTLYAAKDCWNG